MPNRDNTQVTSSYQYIKANLMLAAAKVITIVPTQPIHVVMRQQQAALASTNPRVISIFTAYKEIRYGQTFGALFKGAGPGMTKELWKNLVYKGALIKGAPELAAALLPDYVSKNTSPVTYHCIQSITAGSIAALGDATLGGFLETIATYRSTSHGQHANASFLRELRQENTSFGKINRLYRGFVPTTIKGGIAFSTFFATAEPIQMFSAKLFGIEPKDQTPWYVMATSSVLSGLTVALTSSPIDIIKTQVQMPGAKKTGVVQALSSNYKNHGLAGITAGLPAKILMITIGWGMNFFVTQQSPEKKASKNQEPSSNLSPKA